MLEAIAADPFVSQSEIARRLGLARSTVASHVASLGQKGYILGRAYVLREDSRVVALGGATVDRKYQARRTIELATSNPVTGRQTFGGVARNVCENLARLGISSSLVSFVGDDAAGHSLVENLQKAGADITGVRRHPRLATAEYLAIIDVDGAMLVGAADMGIFDAFTPAFLDSIWPNLAAASWVFADCNPTTEMLHALIARRRLARFKLALDAVSTTKVLRLPTDLNGVDLLFLNEDEARAYLEQPSMAAEDAAPAIRERGVECVVVTRGSQGVVMADADGVAACPAIPAKLIDPTGAGDALIAGTLSSLLAGTSHAQALRSGCRLAALTVECDASVHQQLSPDFFAEAMASLVDC